MRLRMGSLPNLHELGRSERLSATQWGPPLRLPQPTNQHRRLYHTRSAGAAHAYAAAHGAAAWEDFIAEQAAASHSPMSSRSTRSTLTAYHNHVIMPPLRRRDSLSSSCGASSVRRLIAVVRSTPSRFGPTYSRRVLLRNFTALCLAHCTFSAAYLPLVALQSSISAWYWSRNTQNSQLAVFPPPENQIFYHQYQQNNNSGSLLFAILYAFGAMSSLIAPSVVQKLGTNWVLLIGYGCSVLFFGVHLYPVIFTLIPAYVLMGISLGPLTSARVTCLMTLAGKLTYVVGEEDDGEEDGGKREIAKRLTRGLQAAQDFGMVLGNVVAALLVWFTLSKRNSSVEVDPFYDGRGQASDDYSLLDAMFTETDGAERICGSAACPTPGALLVSVPTNTSVGDLVPVVLPCKTTAMLASVCVGCAVMCVVITAVFMDKIKLFVYQDPKERGTGVAALRAVRDAFRDPRLQLAAPLSVFIGLEQGFMYADFSKFYVMCALGVPNISLVFLSMGLLQSVAGFTLSMLLQHIRRYLAIGVGFAFHACLLLVLLLWKPSGDDPALFYVISASWGVCNAIWETLTFTLVIIVYPHTWQAPVAHCFFYRCLGLCLALGLHGALCNATKLYALAVALVLAVAPYTYLETRLESKRRSKSDAL